MQSGKGTCYPKDMGNLSCCCVLGRLKCAIDPQADVECASLLALLSGPSLLESGLLDSKLSNRTAVASYRTPENCHNANGSPRRAVDNPARIS